MTHDLVFTPCAEFDGEEMAASRCGKRPWSDFADDECATDNSADVDCPDCLARRS